MYLVYTFINKIYKWLPIIMLCHCRDDRSFHTNGLRHPVCARCEGITIGFLVGLVSAAIIRLPVKILFLLLLPLVLDGTIQKVTSYESTNIRRLITGLLYGYALSSLIVISFTAVFRFGYGIGLKLYS